MSKFSKAVHAVFGFVKAEAPSVEAEVKVIRDRADAEVAKLLAAVKKAEQGKVATDLRAALAAVSNAVSAHVQVLEAAASAPSAGTTGTTGAAG